MMIMIGGAGVVSGAIAGGFILGMMESVGLTVLRQYGDVTYLVIFAALMGAIIWNIVTWMAGIPSSSSHALIGGLVGAGVCAGGLNAVVWSGLVRRRPRSRSRASMPSRAAANAEGTPSSSVSQVSGSGAASGTAQGYRVVSGAR